MIGLEYIRKLNFDTVDSLAEKLHVTKGLISQWENQKAPIPNKRLEELSKIYNVSNEYFSRPLTRMEKLCLQKEKMLDTSSKDIDKYTITDTDQDGNTVDKITIDGKTSILKMTERLQVVIDFEEVIQELYEISSIEYTEDTELTDIIFSALSANDENIYIITKFVALMKNESNLLIPSILKAVELSKSDDDSAEIHSDLVKKLVPIFRDWRLKEKERTDIEYQEYKELFGLNDE